MLIEQLSSQWETWMLHPVNHSPVMVAVKARKVEILEILLDAAPASWQIDCRLPDSRDNALSYAVSKGSIECVEVLLRRGAKVLPDDGARSPIHTAAKMGDVDMLRILFQALPTGHRTPDILGRTKPGSADVTPLVVACKDGHLECARFLLKQGASPITKANNGVTALHEASRRAQPELLEALISALPKDGSALDIAEGQAGMTPLMAAAEVGALSCARLLVASGASIVTRDKRSWTAAHWAAYNGHNACLGLLLEQTPWQAYDFHHMATTNTTLPEAALLRGHVETFEHLLKLGVPLFENALFEYNGVHVYWTFLEESLVKREDVDPVPKVRLLSELYTKHCPRWHSPRTRKKCRRILRAAITKSNAALVRVLLDAGFSASSPLGNGRTPLSAAMEAGDMEIVQLLRRHGAEK
jgi:ankyrin repeat protein